MSCPTTWPSRRSPTPRGSTGRADSYERLAFLGDVVLSLAVSTAIYPRFENYGAGRLTKLRAQAVSEQACVDVAQRPRASPSGSRQAAPAGVGRNADV